jgi:hypothetical protein
MSSSTCESFLKLLRSGFEMPTKIAPCNCAAEIPRAWSRFVISRLSSKAQIKTNTRTIWSTMIIPITGSMNAR